MISDPTLPQAAPASEPYAWGWLFAIIAFFVGIGVYLTRGPQVESFRPANEAVVTGSSHSYYLIHMPAIPVDDSELKKRAEGWLVSMATRGYRPMLLSDINQRLKSGKALPEKAIVLMFDPGYRQTYQVMAPLLAKYKFPAVWVSDGESVNNRDRRYVSRRVLKAMKSSGEWDVASYNGNALVIDAKNGPPIVIGKDNGVWKANSGRRAINFGAPTDSLNRLHVNWTWTDRQMIDRLQAEEPLRGHAYLTATKIAKHYWGTVVPASTSEDVTFSMKAPVDGRTANISWLGTRGADDAEFTLDIESLSGELWLLMRSDDDIGENAGVCFTNGHVIIGEHRDHQLRQLASVSYGALTQPASFKAKVVLSGSSLWVFVNGVSVAHTDNLSTSKTEDGIVRMIVYDKIMGGAQVESVKLGVTRTPTNSNKGEL